MRRHWKPLRRACKNAHGFQYLAGFERAGFEPPGGQQNHHTRDAPFMPDGDVRHWFLLLIGDVLSVLLWYEDAWTARLLLLLSHACAINIRPCYFDIIHAPTATWRTRHSQGDKVYRTDCSVSASTRFFVFHKANCNHNMHGSGHCFGFDQCCPKEKGPRMRNWSTYACMGWFVLSIVSTRIVSSRGRSKIEIEDFFFFTEMDEGLLTRLVDPKRKDTTSQPAVGQQSHFGWTFQRVCMPTASKPQPELAGFENHKNTLYTCRYVDRKIQTNDDTMLRCVSKGNSIAWSLKNVHFMVTVQTHMHTSQTPKDAAKPCIPTDTQILTIAHGLFSIFWIFRAPSLAWWYQKSRWRHHFLRSRRKQHRHRRRRCWLAWRSVPGHRPHRVSRESHSETEPLGRNAELTHTRATATSFYSHGQAVSLSVWGKIWVLMRIMRPMASSWRVFADQSKPMGDS